MTETPPNSVHEMLLDDQDLSRRLAYKVAAARFPDAVAIDFPVLDVLKDHVEEVLAAMRELWGLIEDESGSST